MKKQVKRLAWMPLGTSRDKQILNVTMLQAGGVTGAPKMWSPSSLALDKLGLELRKMLQKEDDPEQWLWDLRNRLEGVGLLNPDVGEQTPLEEACDLMAMYPPLRDRVVASGATNNSFPLKEEVPGAKELLEERTIYEWMNALDRELMTG